MALIERALQAEVSVQDNGQSGNSLSFNASIEL